MSQLSEQEIVRREKLSKIRALGIDPYPANLYPVDHTSRQIKEDFAEGKKVVIAGRLMAVKVQGKASFAELQDSEGPTCPAPRTVSTAFRGTRWSLPCSVAVRCSGWGCPC